MIAWQAWFRLPSGVTREGILRLERNMLDLWWNALGLDDASWWRIWKGPVPQEPAVITADKLSSF